MALPALPHCVRLLRDKAGLTRLLVLLELQRTTHTTLRTLAQRLDITVQGVSNYVAEMERTGLVRTAQGRYEVTPKGAQQLQDDLGEIKGFVDVSYQRLSVVDRCAALAAGRVAEGEGVGLFMEAGLMVARPRADSPSRGIAAHDAAAGEVVQVEGLAGLVALRPGKLTVLQVPSVEGKATKVAARALKAWLRKESPGARVAAMGTEAQVVARAAGLDAMLFAPAQAAHHAAQLGLDAVLLASADQVRFAAADLDRRNEDAPEPLRYALRDLRVGR